MILGANILSEARLGALAPAQIALPRVVEECVHEWNKCLAYT
jgi:hypothetical protein